MKVIKLLYSISKAGAHQFNIYFTYHIKKLSIIKYTYNFCLFYTDSNNKNFEIISLKIKNTLILANDIFAAAKKKT